MKKGFTLIELLAVIIILAIIAIIATPIITDVIESSKESANLRSIEGYASAIKQKYYDESLGGAKPTIDSTFLSNIDTGGGEVKCDSVLYNNGTILYKCSVQNSEKKYCYANEQHYACDDEDYLAIFTGSGGVETLEGTPIIEKAKELVFDNDSCKTDGTTYNYMDGCYIKGNPNNNYIWYSGFLWRIMGINADGTVRLITDENVTSIPWGASGTAENWDGSHAKDWLNNYFYSKLKGNDIIVEQTWCSETTTDNSSARTACTDNLSKESAYVGLMTIDEYNLAGGSSSYLNIWQWQWTMTPYSSSNAWCVSDIGRANNDSVSSTNVLRAVINVYSDVTITGGNGTLGEIWSSQSGPYILNEDKNVEVTGKLNEKATSGEYVLFTEKKYRVVDKDINGNTKLILDGYYEETAGTVYKMSYGSNNIFSKDTGIGQKLNGDVLNWLTNNSESEKAKLVSDYTWYQNNFDEGQSYTISLNEESPTRSIQATVGLIRVGEMLSGQSGSILTKGYTTTSSYNNASTYWTMTPYTSSSRAWYVGNGGSVNLTSVSSTFGLRAVIVVNSDVTITSGNGTWSNPYQI